MSDTIFFWLSKSLWLAIAPDNLLIVVLLIVLELLRRGVVKTARKSLALLLIVLLTIAVLPMGDWFLFPLESRFSVNPNFPERPDGIIVLGGAEDPLLSELWRQTEINASAERDLAFFAMARKYPDAKLVFTGGNGSLSKQKQTLADVAEALFVQLGMDISRVTFERKSRNTYENATLSKDIVNPKPGEKWVLITSAFHMPRAVGIFCKLGWQVIPYPVDHMSRPDNLFQLSFDLANHLKTFSTAIREWIGMTAYYMTGKTSAFFPSDCG